MEAPLGLGARHPLHAVAAGLEFQPRVGAETGNAGDDFLVAAKVVLAGADDFDLPAVAFGIARVHAEQVGGKQGGLVAAGAGAHFEEDVALVVRVFRQQQPLQFALQRIDPRVGIGQLGFGQFAHVRVGQQLARGGNVGFGLAEGQVLLDHRGQLGVFARQLAVVVDVVGHGRRAQQTGHFIESVGKLCQSGGNGRFHVGVCCE